VPTLGMVAAGAPGNFAMGVYSLFSELENSFGTSHSVTVLVLAGVSPQHYTVVCEDQHGNFAHTTDQIVSGSGFSPDGSIIVGQPGGGAVPTSLNTAYGTVSMGDFVSPQPGYGGGSFCYGLLNGKEMEPSAPIGVFGLPIFQQLWVDFGGNIYGITNDQIWYGWQNYSWQTNDGMDLTSGPATTPVPPSLPSYAPPYTPSAEGTTISGGIGTLVTTDGTFSFGAASGPGWRLMLNGIPIAVGGTSFTTYMIVDTMTVYATGQLFFRMAADSTWRCWTGNQAHWSTGPTASPVPVAMSLSPSRPQLAASSSIGTHVGTVSATMSDGSGFSGTISIGDTTNFAVSGSSIVTAVSPFASSITSLAVTQNGTTYQKEIIIVAT
jgi:hypothetical protein